MNVFPRLISARLLAWRQRPAVRRALRAALWLIASAALLLAALACAIQFWLLPRLGDYKPALAQALSQATGQRVDIDELGGGWRHGHLVLFVRGVSVSQPHSGATQRFAKLELAPSLSSLWRLEPHFSRIALSGPVIHIRRDARGAILINDIDLTQGSGDTALLDWLLRQSEVSIDQATLHWRDEFAGLAELTLTDGRVVLRRGLFSHSLAIGARPPSDWLSSFALAMDWRGDRLADWKTWRGRVRLDVGGVRLSAWENYLNFNSSRVLPQGEGQSSVELNFDGPRIEALNAQLSLRNVLLRLNPSEAAVRVPVLSGKLALAQTRDGVWTLAAQDLLAVAENAAIFNHADIQGEWKDGANGHGKLTLSQVDLAAIKPLLRHLPLEQNAAWKALAPTGFVEKVQVGWRGDIVAPSRYQVSGAFRQLGWQGSGVLPSVTGMSGELNFDESRGELNLRNQGAASVTLPGVFIAPLQFADLNARVNWTREAQGVAVDLGKIRFANADVSGELSGRYRYVPGHAGLVDIQATLGRAPANRVPAYLPLSIDHDTRNWLTQALRRGHADGAQLLLRGDLDHFPFADASKGNFEVHTRADGVTLAYAPGWPALENISGELRFIRNRMEIANASGQVMGARLFNVNGVLPDIEHSSSHLQIEGQASGPTQAFLQYLRATPIDRVLGGLTRAAQTQGAGALKLKLDIPLAHADATQVSGEYQFLRNGVRLVGYAVPPLSEVSGVLRFSETGADSDGLRFTALGGAGQLRIAREPQGRMRFGLNGHADMRAAARQYLPWLAPHLNGQSEYRGEFHISRDLDALWLESSLRGVSSQLPMPLAKQAADTLPLRLDLAPEARGGLRLGVKVGQTLQGQFALADSGEIQRGALRLGAHASLPAMPARGGVAVAVQDERFELDPWLSLGSGDADGAWPTLSVALDTRQLLAQGRVLHQVKAQLQSSHGDWEGQVSAQELAGQLHWQAGAHKLSAKLSRLNLPLSSSANEPNDTSLGRQAANLPALDITVDALSYQQQPLGHLQLAMQPRSNGWQLDQLWWSGPEGRARLTGMWQRDGREGVTALRGQFDSQDLGGLLARFGYPDTLRRGRLTAQGALQWQGGVLSPVLSSLRGDLSLRAENGQFAKINPGVGRLLGVISLQSLPRRFQLDFHDIFSEGFAFNALTGKVNVDNGVFTLNDMKMTGPAADVSLRGHADLGRDRQQLRVTVEPHLSEGVALAGAALLNPVLGVAALAAQKVLQDPVGKLFAYDYEITGSLAAPDIRKLDRFGGDAPREKP